MNVLITEEQSKVILVEGMSDILSTIYEKSTDFSASLYKRIAKRLKFNLKILLTFGAGVGGLMQPLMDMLDGKFNGLTEDQKLLIVVATICIVFNEGKDILKQVIPKIHIHGTIVAINALFTLYVPHTSGKLVIYKLFINCINPVIIRKNHIHDVPGNGN